ncbi:SRPBCC family protein [Jannaschia sp. S6380]|uniref:SRPBCC family protein n=1 Tax=Jannaschia sp. S6380 TaxID=2926408 RepID=UPI001FF51D95|nr:SRPBCC family protein [Jannaschia sp. S6380]MCK0169159.1 SRPBCC family protein [Jannaschia sp. S6380]
MKFVATEDIAAPIEFVWSRISDLETFERRARKRVGTIERRPPGPAGKGTTWSGTAEVMGKRRDVTVTLAEVAAPETMAMTAVTDGMDVDIGVVLSRQGPRLTRMTVTSEAKARSLAARLMLQSAKLARQTLAKRYKGRVANFAASVEDASRRA